MQYLVDNYINQLKENFIASHKVRRSVMRNCTIKYEHFSILHSNHHYLKECKDDDIIISCENLLIIKILKR